MENIKLINGDCLEEMKQIENGTVDLILSDMPYGITQCEWDIDSIFNTLPAPYQESEVL